MSLTKDQTNALEEFELWFEYSKLNEPFILSGYAGSGKTFLSIKFLNIVEEKDICWTVVAPTHKAVGVLRRALAQACLRPTWNSSTIHRLLRLKLKRKGDLEICEETSQTKGSLENLGVVLIDEASMIDSNLLDILLTCAYRHKTRLIFVGDPAQLPPIGESISPLFSIEKACKSHLSEVVRHQGPVLQLATILRTDSFECPPPISFPAFTDNIASVGCLDNNSWLEKAKLSLKKAAKAKKPDLSRILCYTNRYLEKLAPHARRAVYGSKADEMLILPGEVLITRKAVMITSSVDKVKYSEQPGILFGSNEEIIAQEVEHHVFDLSEIEILQKCCKNIPSIETLLVKVLIKGVNCRIRTLPDINSLERKRLDNFLDNLSFKAKNSSGTDSRVLWKAFFNVRDSFASLGPASVLTVHRSQGSTFDEVFVASDVFWPKDLQLRKQLAYVAVTRAKKGVWLLEDKKNALDQEIWRKSLQASL